MYIASCLHLSRTRIRLSPRSLPPPLLFILDSEPFHDATHIQDESPPPPLLELSGNAQMLMPGGVSPR